MMQHKTVLIAGGTGMVGSRLTNHLLSAGYSVIILTRDPHGKKSRHPKLSYSAWDVEAGLIDAAAIAKADAVVQLAGAGVVARPWTNKYKQEIVDSRTKSGALIAKALREVPNKVRVVVSASAIGWYGPDAPGHGPFVESDPADASFLGSTCQLWEHAMVPVKDIGKRLVILRIGIVLAKEGGALPEFQKPLHVRVAAVLGTGQQMVSWIHIDDLCRVFVRAIDNESMQGVYNAVAPHPVTNRHLTLALAGCMHRKGFVAAPVPSFVLRIMLGERSVEVLKSTTVSCSKLLDTGFRFQFENVERALQDLCGRSKDD